MTLYLIGVVWLCCSLLSYAILFGHSQNNPNWKRSAREDYRSDLAFSVGISLLGPFTLFAALIMTGFAQYGLKWK
jgi:hypothetical protein